jgi:hypothetical protein
MNLNFPDAIATAVGAALVVLIPFLRAWVQTKFSPEKMSHVMDIARVAVQAAEKFASDRGLDGDAKLTMAADAVVAVQRGP